MVAMKKQLVFSLIVLLFASFFISFPTSSDAHPLTECGFDQIYQLGDSISHAGNLIREFPNGAATPFAKLPYGKSYFHYATGRCSDGLLIVDFLAMALGLPFPNAMKDTTADFTYGANFAVACSTAISPNVLAHKSIRNPVTNSSLDIQLEWMANHFNSICTNQNDCAEKLENALFLVGEIGGNDYNYAFFSNKKMEELQAMVPQRVIGFGAREIAVPGNFPIGCFPIYLSGFQTDNPEDYNENHCLKGLNSFAMYHNELLQNAIRELQAENPQVTIVYGDYYTAYENALKISGSSGFELRRACCGKGGSYNFNVTAICGYGAVFACDDSYRYVSWDGVHSTRAAYKMMTDWSIHQFLINFGCLK